MKILPKLGMVRLVFCLGLLTVALAPALTCFGDILDDDETSASGPQAKAFDAATADQFANILVSLATQTRAINDVDVSAAFHLPTQEFQHFYNEGGFGTEGFLWHGEKDPHLKSIRITYTRADERQDQSSPWQTEGFMVEIEWRDGMCLPQNAVQTAVKVEPRPMISQPTDGGRQYTTARLQFFLPSSAGTYAGLNMNAACATQISFGRSAPGLLASVPIDHSNSPDVRH